MLTNPDNSINTLRELENRIDTYRGQVTVLEQDIISLSKLRNSHEYTIGQHEARIKELEEFVTKAEDTKKEIETAIANLNNLRDDLTKQTQDLRVALAQADDDLTVALYKKQEVENEIFLKSDALAQRELQVSQREAQANVRESEIESKHEKIKSFVTSL